MSWEPRRIADVDRYSLGVLAVADVALGLYLVGATQATGSTSHALVGSLCFLLAVPAAWASWTGRVPGPADDGVLVNVGLIVFVAVDVALTLPGDALERVGLAVLTICAAGATAALWVRLFAARARPARARARGPAHGR